MCFKWPIFRSKQKPCVHCKELGMKNKSSKLLFRVWQGSTLHLDRHLFSGKIKLLVALYKTFWQDSFSILNLLQNGTVSINTSYRSKSTKKALILNNQLSRLRFVRKQLINFMNWQPGWCISCVNIHFVESHIWKLQQNKSCFKRNFCWFDLIFMLSTNNDCP